MVSTTEKQVNHATAQLVADKFYVWRNKSSKSRYVVAAQSQNCVNKHQTDIFTVEKNNYFVF